MLLIKNNNIKMSKGDDSVLSIALYTRDGELYPISSLEKNQMVFTLKNKCDLFSDNYIFQKDFELFEVDSDNFIPQITIKSEDTKFLRYDTYLWGVKYTLIINNQKYTTTVCQGQLEITSEIG